MSAMMKLIEPDFWAFKGRYSRSACKARQTDQSPVTTSSGEAEARSDVSSK
jgi:hypothetical protein